MLKGQRVKDNNINCTIGKNIKELRERDGITQTDLGRILKVSYQQIQKYEKGINNVNVLFLYLLSNYFDVTTDYFFEHTSVEDENASRSNYTKEELCQI